MNRTAVVLFGILGGSLCLAQNYRCDWSVVGIGGTDMSSSAYRCGSTVGQTAVGLLTSSAHQAFIGFWQIEGQVGIQEAVRSPSGEGLQTRLYQPVPNPARSQVAIRYSLAADGPASLALHDMTGRVVHKLLASGGRRGVYSVTLNRTDDRGRKLGNGVYFLKFSAGEYRQTEKLVLTD
ncbi:MAG: T9SS type A sorting domain-containing protein [candidate division WOR-3 bacterium]